MHGVEQITDSIPDPTPLCLQPALHSLTLESMNPTAPSLPPTLPLTPVSDLGTRRRRITTNNSNAASTAVAVATTGPPLSPRHCVPLETLTTTKQPMVRPLFTTDSQTTQYQESQPLLDSKAASPFSAKELTKQQLYDVYLSRLSVKATPASSCATACDGTKAKQPKTSTASGNTTQSSKVPETATSPQDLPYCETTQPTMTMTTAPTVRAASTSDAVTPPLPTTSLPTGSLPPVAVHPTTSPSHPPSGCTATAVWTPPASSVSATPVTEHDSASSRSSSTSATLTRNKIRERYSEKAKERRLQTYERAILLTEAREREEGRRHRAQRVIEFRFGQDILIVGSCGSLGAWETGNALPLSWTPGNVWTGQVTLSVDDGVVEYKYILRDTNTGRIDWEPGFNHKKNIADMKTLTTTIDDRWGSGIDVV